MMEGLAGKSIWIAGHRGMVGSALVRRLAREGADIVTGGCERLDLRRQFETERFLRLNRPDIVIVAAARVGGILANSTRPAEFAYDNLMIASNVVEAAHRAGVDRLLYLGSSCIYPRTAAQPIDEAALLSGPLEPSNQWYAIAKLAGLKLVQAYRAQYGRNYICAMPCNLYGPGDNFNPLSSHVLPALIGKAHTAKRRSDNEIIVWGTGRPRREFLHVDDCADALVHLLKSYSEAEPINVGAGTDLPISALAELVCAIVGFDGRIAYDPEKPDGTPRKLMNSRKLLALGWAPRITLENGISQAYRWFLQHHSEAVPA